MPRNYDYDQLYPSRFMKAGEFQGREVTLRIADVLLEELEDQKGKRAKGILVFEGTKKQLVLNRTNGECIKGMFGRNTGEWVGKRVTFFPAQVDAFGESTLAIRVKGSPDLARDMQITAKLGRKGDRKVTMKKTGQPPPAKPAQQQRQAAPPPPPADEPPPDMLLPGDAGYDQQTGEVSDPFPGADATP